VDQLLARFGPRRSAWPKKLLRHLEARNAALLDAVAERIGYVPHELFWPLGLAAKELLTGTAEGEGRGLRCLCLGACCVWVCVPLPAAGDACSGITTACVHGFQTKPCCRCHRG
jgi:hypothetical protein